jgi:uncharacterized membrane protein (UPF0127 family)
VPARLLALVAFVLLVVAGTAGGATTPATALMLDGVRFDPELALTPAQRSRGLMFRKRAPADGMLFVFPTDTTGGFWMKNTLVPLTIAFYDARGNRVRKFLMTPCRADPCRIYDPGRRYRFALELPGDEARPAKRIGPVAELVRLGRKAA